MRIQAFILTLVLAFSFSYASEINLDALRGECKDLGFSPDSKLPLHLKKDLGPRIKIDCGFTREFFATEQLKFAEFPDQSSVKAKVYFGDKVANIEPKFEESDPFATSKIKYTEGSLYETKLRANFILDCEQIATLESIGQFCATKMNEYYLQDCKNIVDRVARGMVVSQDEKSRCGIVRVLVNFAPVRLAKDGTQINSNAGINLASFDTDIDELGSVVKSVGTLSRCVEVLALTPLLTALGLKVGDFIWWVGNSRTHGVEELKKALRALRPLLELGEPLSKFEKIYVGPSKEGSKPIEHES